MVSVFPQGSGDVFDSLGAKTGDKAVTQTSKDLRSVSLADSAGIFTKRYVADVMGTILDAPMAPVPVQ